MMNIHQWDDLAAELRGHIVKEIRVHITGDFADLYPGLREPQLEEGCRLDALLLHRYLSFEYEPAPEDEDAYMYALELIPDYRTYGETMILRVSDVDEEGHISVHNILYPVVRIDAQHHDNGDVNLLIYTYESEREGGEHGLVR